jgi:hypothetical protein
MLDDKYAEKLGRLLRNSYSIKMEDQSDLSIGKTIIGMMMYLQSEQERDLRDEANGKCS